jgi:hypothetical protein
VVLSNDPLGLFGGESKQAAPQQPKPEKLQYLVYAALIGFIVFRAFSAGWFDFGDRTQPGPQPITVAGKTLVFLHERDPQPIEHSLLLREMPDWCSAKKLQFRAFDDDIPDEPISSLLSWALTKGVTPPLVVLTDKDDKPAKVMSWPESLEKLEAFIR